MKPRKQTYCSALVNKSKMQSLQVPVGVLMHWALHTSPAGASTVTLSQALARVSLQLFLLFFVCLFVFNNVQSMQTLFKGRNTVGRNSQKTGHMVCSGASTS